jgi:hypothetical protein
MSKHKNRYCGFPQAVFRCRALQYCKSNGLIPSSLGVKNKDLHSMIVSHSGQMDIKSILAGIPPKKRDFVRLTSEIQIPSPKPIPKKPKLYPVSKDGFFESREWQTHSDIKL